MLGHLVSLDALCELDADRLGRRGASPWRHVPEHPGKGCRCSRREGREVFQGHHRAVLAGLGHQEEGQPGRMAGTLRAHGALGFGAQGSIISGF